MVSLLFTIIYSHWLCTQKINTALQKKKNKKKINKYIYFPIGTLKSHIASDFYFDNPVFEWSPVGIVNCQVMFDINRPIPIMRVPKFPSIYASW